MDNNFFKKVLENLDIAIAITDENNNVIFKNHDIQDNTSCLKKKINIDGTSYNLLILNQSNQAHQDFINTVSHELRTPLTSIRGFADTMISSNDQLTQEQRHKFLSIIRNQADRLTRLVENLIEVSNISKRNKLIFKQINFLNFISPIITIFERKYQNINYVVIIEPNLPDIWADSDVLEQIMTNLIDNASKYSFDNATVTIKAECANDAILIKVIDEATKIPENQLENIFNKFARIDNPLTRKVEGSGLGLFITRALVEKLNGNIKAENYANGNVFITALQVASIEKQLGSKISGDKN